MTIQWYPGHMHKAQKEMRKVLSQVDVVIEVLDARIPFSSENPMISDIRGNKPCIKLLNKSDLADGNILKEWQNYFEASRDIKTLSLSMADPSKLQLIQGLCEKLVPHKASGPKKIKAMICGIPNVGKSTIINGLVGRVVAKTGNEPAVTKGQQLITINDGLSLIDTPGVLWPKQRFENASYRLAVSGAIKDTAMDYDDVAYFAIAFLLADYPERLLERFVGLDLHNEPWAVLEEVGKRNGCLGAGGRVDMTKAGERLIRDIRQGAFGALCMESPSRVMNEIAEEEAREALRKESEGEKKNTKRKR